VGALLDGGGDVWVSGEFSQSLGHSLGCEFFRSQAEAGPESAEAVLIVRLIMCHGHQELWDGCGESLRQSADATVMHKGGGMSEEGAEGRILHGEDG
jgi:hypothetical protein